MDTNNKSDTNYDSQNTIKKYNSLIGELYIDATCDVGFKKLMSNEEILVDFLNTFLPKRTPKITSATLLPEEMLGDLINKKKVFFDVRAKDESGRTYIIEVQRKPQEFFVKRSVYYISRELSSQGKAGELKEYEVLPIYSISVLNFIPHNEAWNKYYYNVFTMKRDGTNEELGDVLTQIYIILPLMKLDPEKLRDRKAKWCYLLRYAVELNKEMICKLKWTEERIFEKMKKILETSRLTEEEIDRVQQIEWDYEAYMSEKTRQATEEGLEEGLEKGLKKGLILAAKGMLAKKLDIKLIAECVNLPESKIQELKASMEEQ